MKIYAIARSIGTIKDIAIDKWEKCVMNIQVVEEIDIKERSEENAGCYYVWAK